MGDWRKVGLINAAGMLQECWVELFKGNLVQQRQMWPWGKSQDRHSETGFHFFCSMQTFLWNILCCMAIGGVVKVKLTSYGVAAPSNFYTWFNLF